MNQDKQQIDSTQATALSLYIKLLEGIFKEGVNGTRKLIPIPQDKNANPYRCIENGDYAVKLVTSGSGLIWKQSEGRLVALESASIALREAGINVVFYHVDGLTSARFVKQDVNHGYISICLPLFKLLRAR